MAKDAFSKRKELLTGGMSKRVKKNIVQTVIWSVALYSAETWSLRKEENEKKRWRCGYGEGCNASVGRIR